MNLRQYQREAIDSLYEYFKAHASGNPLIALPTGTGKSYVLAYFIKEIFERWPQTRVVICTHRKQLITQDAKALESIWPDAPYGVYSAGLKSKQTIWPIIFGGVASMVNNIEAFGSRDLFFIDEAHLLSQHSNSMYQKIIKQLTEINPNMRVIGLTATPYRMGQGSLLTDGIFTHMSYDHTGMKSFNQLIADGFLCPLVSKKAATQVDISKVPMNNGDFAKRELESAVDKKEITFAACKEIIDYGHDRSAWLVFASGIKHAEHVTGILKSFGVAAECVHSKKDNNDTVINAFRAGDLRCVVNNDILTTGFDHPAIDLIGMLRPTASTGLWVQMAGRGTRPSPETMKKNCLLLDFAGNTARLGPINDPLIPRPRGKGAPGVAPVKICPNCGTYNHTSARVCELCQFEFPIATHIERTAATIELLRTDEPEIAPFKVDRVIYKKHKRQCKLPLLKVTYVCGIRAFDEYVCIEHNGWAGEKAKEWWKIRMGSDATPPTVDDAIQWTSRLRVPKKIKVWVNKKWPEVMAYLWNEETAQ